MQKHWKKFRKDRFYLLKYFSATFLIGLAVIGIQSRFVDWSHYRAFDLSLHGLWLMPLGLILGVQIPVLIHNCVHGNIKIKWLNQVLGELAGVYVLLGMAAFELNHRMHHAHADSDMDPHNPEGKSFLPFFFANNFGGTRPVFEKFLKFHGDTKANRAIFKASAFFHFVQVPVRALFWLFLLGPSLFVTFFLPSYLFHMFVFAHINFATHRKNERGEVEVLNLSEGLYYRLVNFFGSGVYFHKNHHLNPNHYNPRTGAANSWLLR